MDPTKIEQSIRSLFAGLKRDKVESLLVHQFDWGINVRMFLNGDIFELDLIDSVGGYEVSIVGCEDTPPVQINELSQLTQFLQLF